MIFKSCNRPVALVVSGLLLVVAAACGSDDESSSTDGPGPTTTSPAPSATTTAGATTGPGSTSPGSTSPGSNAPASTTPGSTTPGSTAAGESTGSAGCPAIDSSLDEVSGIGAGRFLSDLACAADKPLKAEGDPIIVGFQNAEGDPSGSFPEYTAAALAAVEYINDELGGLGADIQNGKPGRPIQLEVCKMAITPDDSQRCANELLAKSPEIAISSVNFFGNHFPVYAASKIPVLVGTAVTIGDFTSPGVYAIGSGGGCLGSFTGLVQFTTDNLGSRRLGVPWADVPAGVVCYYDSTAKPLDVLSGKEQGSSKLAGSIPDMEYLGVPIKPATPDLTAQATQLLDFEPDAIIMGLQSADCWNLLDNLGRLGWTSEQIPLVMDTSCLDFAALEQAGDLAEGIYFLGGSSNLLSEPSTLTDPTAAFEAQSYQTKPSEYGMPDEFLDKGFATRGWSVMMSLWEASSDLAVSGEDVDSATLDEYYKSTQDQHIFGSTPIACASAPQPYIAVCNRDVTVTQWDGTKLNPVVDSMTGIDLVAGTELKTGP